MNEKAASCWSSWFSRSPDKACSEKRFFAYAHYFFCLNDAKETLAWQIGGLNAKKQ